MPGAPQSDRQQIAQELDTNVTVGTHRHGGSREYYPHEQYAAELFAPDRRKMEDIAKRDLGAKRDRQHGEADHRNGIQHPLELIEQAPHIEPHGAGFTAASASSTSVGALTCVLSHSITGPWMIRRRSAFCAGVSSITSTPAVLTT